MVKGISRQVIVVDGVNPKLFEQAIFILKDDASHVTDEALIKEADLLIQSLSRRNKRHKKPGLFCGAVGGACITGIIWLLTAVL